MHRRKFLACGPLGLTSAMLSRPAAAAQTATKESGLKITAIETWILKTGSLVLLVRTDAGITGIGECSPMNIKVIAAMIEQALTPRLLGKNPLEINLLWEAMFFGTYKLGTMGIQPEAIAGIDIALWDLLGKVTRQPLHRLLGGKHRERVRMYASIGGGATMSVEDMARRASEAVSRGFTALKIRMDWGNQRTDVNPERDWQMISTVRRVVGSKIDLGFDPNNGYSVSTAIRMGRRLQDQLEIAHYEEPIPQHDYRGLAQVVAALDVPVAAGEHEYTRWQFRDLIETANVDILQPDLVKCAGITEALRIASLASTFNRALVPHQTQPSIGNTANLHFTAALCRTETPQEFNYDMEKAETMRRAFPNMPALEKGFMRVPDGPGLGLELDEKELARLRA
jgi:L-alanine-DL-glutamate epimerase-like enolase superfamily enzyme